MKGKLIHMESLRIDVADEISGKLMKKIDTTEQKLGDFMNNLRRISRRIATTTRTIDRVHEHIAKLLDKDEGKFNKGILELSKILKSRMDVREKNMNELCERIKEFEEINLDHEDNCQEFFGMSVNSLDLMSDEDVLKLCEDEEEDIDFSSL